MIKDSIFIPIAACEERFIEQTVRSALLNADNPENIYFGIFNNIIDINHSLLNNDFIVNHEQIFYTEIISPAPMGVGFGRMNASLLFFKDFEYMFQIDAHTLFTKKWDTIIIEMFNKIKNENNIEENKLILSGSTGLSWTYDENNPDELYAIVNDGKSLLKIDPFNLEENCMQLIEQGMATNKFVYDGKQGNLLSEPNINFPIVYGYKHMHDFEYQESNAVHATFMFSKLNLIRNVLHDPKDMFNGDQTNYSIRLLSRGYRIFTSKYPVISVLNKFIDKMEGTEKTVEHLDKIHNWKTIHLKNNGGLYHQNIIINGSLFFQKMISGEYFGYWGTPDKQSLEKAKEKINYPQIDNN